MKFMQRKSCPIICKGFSDKNKVCKFGVHINITTDLFDKRIKIPTKPCYGPYTNAELAEALELVKCKHEQTYYDPEEWPTGEAIEVCKTCDMSRSHWEQGHSDWQHVDIETTRAEVQQAIDAIKNKAYK